MQYSKLRLKYVISLIVQLWEKELLKEQKCVNVRTTNYKRSKSSMSFNVRISNVMFSVCLRDASIEIIHLAKNQKKTVTCTFGDEGSIFVRNDHCAEPYRRIYSAPYMHSSHSERPVVLFGIYKTDIAAHRRETILYTTIFTDIRARFMRLSMDYTVMQKNPSLIWNEMYANLGRLIAYPWLLYDHSQWAMDSHEKLQSFVTNLPLIADMCTSCSTDIVAHNDFVVISSYIRGRGRIICTLQTKDENMIISSHFNLDNIHLIECGD